MKSPNSHFFFSLQTHTIDERLHKQTQRHAEDKKKNNANSYTKGIITMKSFEKILKTKNKFKKISK